MKLGTIEIRQITEEIQKDFEGGPFLEFEKQAHTAFTFDLPGRKPRDGFLPLSAMLVECGSETVIYEVWYSKTNGVRFVIDDEFVTVDFFREHLLEFIRRMNHQMVGGRFRVTSSGVDGITDDPVGDDNLADEPTNKSLPPLVTGRDKNLEANLYALEDVHCVSWGCLLGFDEVGYIIIPEGWNSIYKCEAFLVVPKGDGRFFIKSDEMDTICFVTNEKMLLNMIASLCKDEDEDKK